MEIFFLIVFGTVAIYIWGELHDSKLDHPPPVEINARYPDVYDAIIEALETFGYEDYSWSIRRANGDVGHIHARCLFREQVTSDLRAERRAISLEIRLAEIENHSTRMEYSFCVFSNYGRVEAARIVACTESAIEFALSRLLERTKAG